MAGNVELDIRRCGTLQCDPSANVIERVSTSAPALGELIVGQLVENGGYAIVDADLVNSVAGGTRERILREIRGFFTSNPDEEMRREYQREDFMAGFRGQGVVWSDPGETDPDKGDKNTGFVWHRGIEVPNGDRIASLLQAFSDYDDHIARPICSAVDQTLRRLYGFDDEPVFTDNHTLVQAVRCEQPRPPRPQLKRGDIIQQAHQDGAYMAVSIMDDAGHWGQKWDGSKYVWVPITLGEREILVTSSQVMTDMTDGRIPPWIHKVVHEPTRPATQRAKDEARYNTYQPPVKSDDSEPEYEVRNGIVAFKSPGFRMASGAPIRPYIGSRDIVASIKVAEGYAPGALPTDEEFAAASSR